ncbi:hypothetical protein N0M98_16555 [Paenibacillus doosanensis]|uniref:hypothetical protein n=1 Tax=Paenibacillus doosanensis TaxID=1229154 RepID=UPI0021809A47|nr:hypothetical protein [Paenibacillus doosanensis]MCS7461767.1 hypothetical protein [Paenibacillus doosanensis]
MYANAHVATRPGGLTRNANEKAALLRTYEEYCYQVTFYMLRDERQALEAAEQTLAALFLCKEWRGLTHSLRMERIKRIAMLQALECRKRLLAASVINNG